MKNRQILSGALAGIVIVYIFSTLVVEKRMYDLRANLDTSIENQEQLIVELAPIIGASDGSGTQYISEIIPACTSDKSQRYDELLASLDKGLSQAELITLKDLFNQCASVPAQRRGVMVLMFENEIQTLEKFVAQRALLGEQTYSEDRLLAFKNLVVKEKEIRVQFYALVELQRNIIDALLSGATASDSAIVEIQSQVQSVQQKYGAAIAEASQLRATVVTP